MFNDKPPSGSIPLPATPSPKKDNGRNSLPTSLNGVEEKRRGTPPGATRGPYKKRGPEPDAPRPGLAPGPGAPMFTAETVKPIVSLPFNLATVRTGFEGFLLSKEEAEVLGASGATVLNTWVQIDPKYVALITFSIAMISITTEKTLLYLRWTREMMEARQREEQKAAA